MKTYLKLIPILFLLLLCEKIFAQGSKSIPDERFYIAERHVENKSYADAIKIYQELLVEEPDNQILNFMIGYCYLFTANEKENAVKHLEKSLESELDTTDKKTTSTLSFFNEKILNASSPELLKEIPLEAFYFLGKAYHSTYKFDEATNSYSLLLSREDFPPKAYEFKEAIQKEIEECKAGKELVKNPIKMAVTNIEDLNSEYSDHSPVLSADESVILITSKRKFENTEETPDGQYFENVYMYEKDENSNWAILESATEKINRQGNHDATIGLSVDGKELYIFRDDIGGGDIYVSQLEKDKWTTPEKLGENVNSKFRETHATISADGQTLYFTSNRQYAGFRFKKKKQNSLKYPNSTRGSKDIYEVKKLPDGTWGEPQRLSDVINTPYDEESPYIHPDGTLYFSSRGHNTMGGYDIFAAKQNEQGMWQKPENIGYPINTTDDDIFYILSANSESAYYSSDQKYEGAKGKTDIYQIGFAADHINNLAVLENKVEMCDGSKPEDVVITITDLEKDEVAGIYRPNLDDGNFVMMLPPGREYAATYEVEGNNDYKVVNDTFVVAKRNSYYNIRRKVILDATELCKKTPPVLITDTTTNVDLFIVKNIQFEINVYNKFLLPETYKNLDDFADYLKTHPGALIEINGHCCEMGPTDYNQRLSNRRANYVKNYLIKKGVPAKTFETQGFSESKPIAINRNADGSWKTGSLEFNRRVEFNVLKPGETIIKVQQLPIPPEFRISADQ